MPQDMAMHASDSAPGMVTIKLRKSLKTLDDLGCLAELVRLDGRHQFGGLRHQCVSPLGEIRIEAAQSFD
jgi:hypothetical protein